MFRLGGRLGRVLTHRLMPRLPLAPVLARTSLRSSLAVVCGCSCAEQSPPQGGCIAEDPDAELADSWTDGLLFALGGPIYAGTNEIQRNIIAERLLGLPREAK